MRSGALLNATISAPGQDIGRGMEYGIECDNGSWYWVREDELRINKPKSQLVKVTERFPYRMHHKTETIKIDEACCRFSKIAFLIEDPEFLSLSYVLDSYHIVIKAI